MMASSAASRRVNLIPSPRRDDHLATRTRDERERAAPPIGVSGIMGAFGSVTEVGGAELTEAPEPVTVAPSVFVNPSTRTRPGLAAPPWFWPNAAWLPPATLIVPPDPVIVVAMSR